MKPNENLEGTISLLVRRFSTARTTPCEVRIPIAVEPSYCVSDRWDFVDVLRESKYSHHDHIPFYNEAVRYSRTEQLDCSYLDWYIGREKNQKEMRWN